jgi:hypothetical protein
MTTLRWWYLAAGLVVFYLLMFEVPGWIAGTVRTGQTPWTDF